MRFIADMDISPRTVAKLNSEVHDAVHLAEQGLEKLEDRYILIKAREEKRIVLTVDLDFGYLLAITKAELR